MARPKKEKEVKQESLETQLWKAADKLRKNIDAAEQPCTGFSGTPVASETAP